MSLQNILDKTGQFPRVQLMITSLQTNNTITLKNFLEYSFDQSVLIPVDTFSFKFAAPDDPLPYTAYFNEGDICTLSANGEILATGIIDNIESETDKEFGEVLNVSGRDLMGQFEDHDAISLDATPIYSQSYTVTQAFNALAKDTRMRGLRTQNAPSKGYLFATEPGESKLAALQRFMEPLNIIAWMDPDGTCVIGKPDMAQGAYDNYFLVKSKRVANVLQMKATRASAIIPNIMVPIWSGQVTNPPAPILKQNVLYNPSTGPATLLYRGHRLPKCVVVSNPDGTSPQELSQINAINAAGGSNLLQAYAKRELARQNVKELIVQATVPGHYNNDGTPLTIDTVYNINYDRGNVSENMYLYQVQYRLSLEQGQRTNLFFCKLGRIVADIVSP